MEKPKRNTRRILLTAIAVVGTIQVGILIYLSILLWPTAPQSLNPPGTEEGQIQLPSASTAGPGGTNAMPSVQPQEIFVGSLVGATNYVHRARMFDQEMALAHIAYLASDELGGRLPGSSDMGVAAEYVAAQFAEYGLQPAGENDSYFQTFSLPYGFIMELPELTIIPPPGEVITQTYDYRTDYRALTGGYVGAGEADGQVVWLNECLSEDYQGLDMVGKIVLCRFSGDNEVYRQAIEHQVGGLLLLDRETDFFRRGGYRDTAWVPETIPTYLISERVGEDLLTGTDHTLDDLSLLYTATPLSTTVRMVVDLEEQREAEGINTLGLLPGADPDYGDEVVVIGAHLDHLGREPDGAVMYGANDNASGVATLLEIARLWHEQDYRPARSVLFAAWDGEEQGLLGSTHYVHNPTLPITSTMTNLNLDMVSAGDYLRIDGEGPVVAQLQATAEVFGITTTLTSDGRSDHMPFLLSGIPAAMLIYWPDPYYHSPEDTIDVIDPEKLRTVGVLSLHTLSALAQGEVEIERAVARMRAAIAAGDRGAFEEGLDPRDPDLQAAQAAWFDNLWTRELTEMSIVPNQVRIGDGEAEVMLTLSYHWADSTRREAPVSYDVRFVQRDDMWTYAGYELETISDIVTVARFEDVPVDAQTLLSDTQEAYLSLTAELGMAPITGTRFIYYPNSATMRTIARPAADQDTRWLVSSAGLAELAWGRPITPALVNLTLNQMGLPPDAAPWLREGLLRHYEPDTQRVALPALLSAEAPSFTFGAYPLADDLQAEVAEGMYAQAWSITEYLLEQYGTEGLQALCAAWGETGDINDAFRQALGLSADQLVSAWQTNWLAPLRADADAIQQVLTARAEAVLGGDQAGFLASVNPADAVLRTEERNWFSDLTDNPALSYAAQGQIVGWSAAGDEAIVELNVTAALSDEQSSRATYDARFLRSGGRWLYAGIAWNERVGDNFVLKYQGHDDRWAEHVLALAETAYEQVRADMGATPPMPQEIKVYEDGNLFHASVFLSLPDWVAGWAEPGESIKLWLRDDSEQAILHDIAWDLAHKTLFAQGIDTPWLHEGVGSYEGSRVFPLGSHWAAGRYMPTVQEAVRRHGELALDELPTFENLSQDELGLAFAQSWSVVSFIAEQYGLAELRQFIAQFARSDDIEANLRAALGVDPEQFMAEWQAYTRLAGVSEDLLALAQRFDPERALSHIRVLASPEYGGRQAGTEGADLAAAYIAEQFAALGLEPFGDPLTVTEGSEIGYLQHFPVSYTRLISTPVLALLDADGAVQQQFVYRQDFIETDAEGAAEGVLVWLNSADLEGMHFDGAVIIESDLRDPVLRAAQLQEHGAGGLIAVTNREAVDFQTGYSRPISTVVTIPVFEITGAAFDGLLEQLGLQYLDLVSGPPSLPLDAQMQMSVARSPITNTLTANVLGYLPGSDPRMANEVLVVGAYYDHIGQVADGLIFPGANQNASGVATMLEMLRVWQAQRYQPSRSVLFVAWGGQEVESAGVNHYLLDPAVPLTRTVGAIALDSVAASRGYKLLFYGTREHDQSLIWRLEAGAYELDRRAWRRGSAGEGWHEPFNASGIATMKLIWDEAEQNFYSPNDTADAIDIDHLATSGEILTLTMSWLTGR